MLQSTKVTNYTFRANTDDCSQRTTTLGSILSSAIKTIGLNLIAKFDKTDLFLITLSLILLFFWGSRVAEGYGGAWDTQYNIVLQYIKAGNNLVDGNGFYFDTSNHYPTFYGPIYPAYIGIMDNLFDPGRFKLLTINLIVLAAVILVIRRVVERLTATRN